jgi:NADH:ubiquinone oxidoreductase subunit F (NADH-binding)/Pyruvate/2-oxoacid:ferredoxin oxidoreductase delta subunit/(2Fe-2S) ferredoxin
MTGMNSEKRTNLLMDLLKGLKIDGAEAQKEMRVIKREIIDKPMIYVGAGTCGLGAGAGETISAIKKYLEDNKLVANVMEVGCIGLCTAEPIVDVQIPGKNRISFKNVTQEKVDDVLNTAFNGKPEMKQVLGQFPIEGGAKWENITNFNDHPFFVRQRRIVLKNCGLIDPESIEEYIAFGGYSTLLDLIKKHNGAAVCDLMEKSGLRGRGGGGFPTGRKWKVAQKEQNDQKYIICNADEGDPGAFMDRAVIEGDPHRLLEGMAIGAYAIGASIGYIYIRAEYPLAIKRLQIAIKQAKEYGLLGKNIFGTGFDFELKIKMGAGAFVCGEETALIHSIEGKRGMPRPRPPFPSVSGLFGKPTVINNVETFANIPEIFAKGWEWFASVGTETSKGTKVFALSGKIKNTGLVEIPMGTTIRQILFDIADGIANGKKFKAVQIGGPSGGCITDENLDIQIDYESLLKVGAMMGSGGLVVMDEDNCMVDVAKFFMDFIQRESCGKCIPCREGTRRMLEILESITTKPIHNGPNSALERMRGVMQLEKLGQIIKETSLCALGQSAPNPVLSTLKWFRKEYEEHIFERNCPTRTCTELRKFKIHADLCTGCTLCARKCPTGAIIGSKKAPHYIIDDKCIGCGSCKESCNFNAIEMI